MMYRPAILKLLHDDSHLGIQRAKGSVYWPGITEDRKHLVNKYSHCLEDSKCNQKEPHVPFVIPIVAWKTIASDLFTFDSKSYLLVIDLFSHFPVVRLLPNETAKSVILEVHVHQFGIPETIISDNGPCYKSQEFREF